MSKLSEMSDEKFNSLMEEVDAFLRGNDVPIHNRPMDSAGELSKRFKVDIMLSKKEPGTPFFHANDGTFDRIDTWYTARYGDLLKIDMTLGRTVKLIRNDPYSMKIPLIYGKVHFYCNTETVGTKDDPLSGRYNILNAFNGLTPAYSQVLDAEELKDICDYFVTAMDYRYKIDAVRRIKFTEKINNLLKEGTGDLISSVNYIFENPTRYGQSRWASLQATEKFIKSYIASKGSTYPNNHRLVKDLGPAAETLGWAEPNAGLLQIVECSAGVRYGEQLSTLKEAVTASQTALMLCASLAGQILKDSGRLDKGIDFQAKSTSSI